MCRQPGQQDQQLGKFTSAVTRAPNVAWTMDFVSDQTVEGTRFRALTVVDVFTRECLAIEPGKSLRGADVVNVLSRITTERGAPKRIYCDNGSEFVGRLGRSLGLCQQRDHGVLTTRKADGQRLHRVVQRLVQGRVLECLLVLEPGRCAV